MVLGIRRCTQLLALRGSPSLPPHVYVKSGFAEIENSDENVASTLLVEEAPIRVNEELGYLEGQLSSIVSPTVAVTWHRIENAGCGRMYPEILSTTKEFSVLP